MSSFSIVQDLNQHLIVHEEKKQFKCRFCRGFIFSQKNDLLEHVKSFHEGSGHYRCSICNKNFQYKIDVRKHMKVVHDKKFDLVEQKVILVRKKEEYLKTIHKGKILYKCSICNTNFQNKINVTKHMKVVHDETFDLVEKKVVHEEKHVKSGHHFKCSICNNRFSTVHDLNHHMTLHPEKKPLKCPHCNIRFSPKFDLGHHVKNCGKGKSPEKKPLKCPHCTS